MKRDLDNFNKEFNQRLTLLTTEQQLQSRRVNEVEAGVERLENWAQDANEALLLSLKQQKVLQEKLTDRESRSRWNNIHIYGVSEGMEGESVIKFVETLLKRELVLPEDCNLQIQRAHQSLTRNAADGALPRSITVNFLDFSTRERILREV